MKAIKGLTIHKKLASYRAVFPHDDRAEVRIVAEIYNNVLEFSRPGLYSDSVTRAAWELLLTQIKSGTTSQLIQALGRRPLVEVMVFLTTLTTRCMSDVEGLIDSVNQKERTSMLPPSGEEVSVLAPVLHCISQFVIQSDSARKTALDVGVLDMILRIYVILPTLSDSTRQNADSKVALQDSCRLTLEMLSQSQHQEAVLNHPVCTLWTDVHSQPPGYSVGASADPAQERCAAWRRVEKSCVERRMIVIYKYTLWKPDAGGIADMEACNDIVEFANRELYGSKTVKFAYLAMLKHMASNGDSAPHLMDALARGSREDVEYVFSGFIRLWLEFVKIQIQTAEYSRPTTMVSGDWDRLMTGSLPATGPSEASFYGRESNQLFLKIMDVDNVLFNIIKFMRKVAEQNPTVRLGMLDAGSLAIVLTAFADPAFKLSSLTGVPGKEAKGQGGRLSHRRVMDTPDAQRISSAAINAEASTLSVLIRNPKFIKPWRGPRLETRLSLCSSLIDSLLGQELDGEYEVTRALFRNIVTSDP